MSASKMATPPNERTVTITRVFDAPRELVFKMWTDPKHMAQWWGPHQFTNPVCELDARPSGNILIHMRAPDGTVYPMTGIFREIVAPKLIVFTAYAEDSLGKRLLESLTTVTFEAQGKKTKLTVNAAAKGLAPIAPQMLAGMEAGWTQSLEKLEKILKGGGEKTMGMDAKPEKEHAWLHKLVGDWTAETSCVPGPDQPPMTSTGSESVRSIGGLWTQGEGSAEMPDGGSATSLMTLGYDPAKQRFVGTFVASMTTHMWLYEGTLDASGKVLTLDTEGPSFGEDGKMAKYQDIITFIDDDHRMLTSRIQGEDGSWNQFMTAHYRRKT